MPKSTFRRKDILLFLFFAAILHILLAYMFSARLGNMEGIHVADTISEAPPHRELAQQNLQDMPEKFAKDSGPYRNILFFLSLPFDPIFRPVHKRWAMKPFLEKEIPMDEYTFRTNLISIITMVLNSLAFSIIAYGVLKIAIRQRKQT